MINIKIVVNETDFKRKVWDFMFFTAIVGRSDLRFTYYSLQERLTRRHKWKSTEYWSSNNFDISNCTRPPIPQGVNDSVKGQLIKIIQDLNIV